MAEQVKPEAGKGKSVGRPGATGSVRYFRKPQVRLIRMGREVAVFKAAWGEFDVKNWRLEFRDAVARVETAELTAKRIEIDMPANRLVASGTVRLEEGGVVLAGDELTSVPSLSRVAFRGKPRLETDDREAAVALLGARGL